MHAQFVDCRLKCMGCDGARGMAGDWERRGDVGGKKVLEWIWAKENISRVPDQNGISQACHIVEIHHSGPEPSILSTTATINTTSVTHSYTHTTKAQMYYTFNHTDTQGTQTQTEVHA